MGKLDLSGSRFRVEHANRRFMEFKTELAAFNASSPYASITELNAERTEQTHKIKLVKPIPPGLYGTAFDIVSNLRSALDLAGHAAATATGLYNTIENAYFPFRKFASEYNGARNRGKEIPKEIFDVMWSYQPYEGGNYNLYALNELANSNKHRIVVPYAMRITSQRIIRPFDGIIEMPTKTTWDSEKNELIVARTKAGVKIDAQMEITAYISIGQIESVRGMPAEAIFMNLYNMVLTVLDAVQTEADRIGL